MGSVQSERRRRTHTAATANAPAPSNACRFHARPNDAWIAGLRQGSACDHRIMAIGLHCRAASGDVPVRSATAQPTPSKPAESPDIVRTVAVTAPRKSRATTDASNPRDNDRNNVTRMATTARNTCPPLTPPTITGKDKTGTSASTPYTDRAPVAQSFPRITSNAVRSVRKSKPRVPERFSRPTASDVCSAPARQA